MARKAGPLEHCDGKWSRAKYINFIKNLLRSGSRKWSPNQTVLREARTSRGMYLCNECKEEVPVTVYNEEKKRRTKNVVVDHVTPVVSIEDGFGTWDDFIEGLFCEKDNLQVLCGPCHSRKTAEECSKSAAYRALRKDANPEYNSWKSMRARCLHEHHHAYPRYGGRGITIDPRWDDFFTFRDDMAPRPEGTTLDRIDNDKGYYPGNCRWATRTEQANNRSNSLLLDLEGEVKTVAQWSEELGIPTSTIHNRLIRGDEPEQALDINRVRGVRTPNIPIEDVYADFVGGMSYDELSNKYGYHKDYIRKSIYKLRKEKDNE